MKRFIYLFFQKRDLPVAADRVKSAFSPSLG